MIGVIYDGQMEYNARPRYNISAEVLRTKIVPQEIRTNGSFLVDENGNIVEIKPKANWGPLVVAAALAFVAMG
jgi:hypothetical protein